MRRGGRRVRALKLLAAIVSGCLLLAHWTAGAGGPFDAGRNYWAFKRPQLPQLPAVKNKAWVRNPIDAFILAKLEEKNLKPAPRADKITLIRRASLDLIGLPPTPEEVEAFLADDSPDAFDKVVDRLLASPHYGERWARHWLDLVRYAESEGFKSDETRPNAWRYRDYVIKALNEDKPYDRFIMEQLAGDEIAPEDPDALVATAFNRHWADESNARNLRLRRQEILNDMTDTVGSVFLGLTIACARCHDHKFDPIAQRDYYRMQAFFAASHADDEIILASERERKEHEQRMKLWEEKTQPIRLQLAALEEPYRQKLYQEKKEKFPPEIQEAIDTPSSERTALQWQLYLKALPQLEVSDSEVGKAMKGEEKARWEELRKRLDEFAQLKPKPLPMATGIRDIGRQAPPTYVLSRGQYDAPEDEVEPGFLSVLSPEPVKISPPKDLPSTGRRSALANWIASSDNPLTARVMVNRIWHYHFGRGIVATPSDFGFMGERPTHPELLDWLAVTFIRSGWSIKAIHRLIMTSNTYQQASTHNNSEALEADPENKLLWRFPRRRLEGEIIRDAILAVSGELNTKMGGPSVFPELPDGLTTRGGWKVTEDAAERNRRSIYVFVKRNLRYPLFEAFDMPDTHETCPRRNATTTPIQALMLLNDRTILEYARAFAGRLLREAGPDRNAQIERAYLLAYSRRPDQDEKRAALEFLNRQAAIIMQRLAENRALMLPPALKDGDDKAQAAALVDFCHVLFNSNEFLYIE